MELKLYYFYSMNTRKANYIDSATLEYYGSLYKRGDASLIARKSGMERGTIYIALSTGRCGPNLACHIEEFYKARAREMQAILETATDYDE